LWDVIGAAASQNAKLLQSEASTDPEVEQSKQEIPVDQQKSQNAIGAEASKDAQSSKKSEFKVETLLSKKFIEKTMIYEPFEGDKNFARTRLLKKYLEKEVVYDPPDDRNLTSKSIGQLLGSIVYGRIRSARGRIGHSPVKQFGLLIHEGASLEIRGGPRQQTALHLAVRSCSPDLVELLLNRGAERTMGDGEGVTPLGLSGNLLESIEKEINAAGITNIANNAYKNLLRDWLRELPPRSQGPEAMAEWQARQHRAKYLLAEENRTDFEKEALEYSEKNHLKEHSSKIIEDLKAIKSLLEAEAPPSIKARKRKNNNELLKKNLNLP
jgi:hypothetical protein